VLRLVDDLLPALVRIRSPRSKISAATTSTDTCCTRREWLCEDAVMADMREFDRMPRPADGDPWAAAEVLRDRAAHAAEARRRLAEVVGEAATDNGQVRVRVGAEGLQELVIEPRAMRMASTDLAATIVELTRQGREDLVRRRDELAAELGVQRGGVDLDESLARLEQLRDLVAGGHGDLRAAFERFRQQAGG